MSNKLLPGLTALVFACSTVPTVAMQRDDVALVSFSGINQFADAVAADAQFIAGREIAAPRVTKIAAQSSASAEQADLYYAGQSTLTLTLAVLAGLAIGAVAIVGKASAGRKPRDADESPRRDVWKSDLQQMLEADLINLDSLAHGFPAR